MAEPARKLWTLDEFFPDAGTSDHKEPTRNASS
jgi:hypothetical protein